GAGGGPLRAGAVPLGHQPGPRARAPPGRTGEGRPAGARYRYGVERPAGQDHRVAQDPPGEVTDSQTSTLSRSEARASQHARPTRSALLSLALSCERPLEVPWRFALDGVE